MKNAILGFVFSCMYLTAFCQEGKIAGKIFDNEEIALELVNVILFSVNKEDTTFFGGSISDVNGDFTFVKLPFGNYELRLAHILYKEHSLVLNLDERKSVYILKPVVLQQKEQLMDEVVVSVSTPLFIRKVDRLVFNVENSAIRATNEDALELIRNLPGVWVNSKEAILLNGKGNVLITINDKRTYLAGEDLANLLKSISPDEIENIELITSPPAKYESEGLSGLINIKTKKSFGTGLNTRLTLGYGQSIAYGEYLPKTSTGASVAYGKKAFSIFGNYSFRSNERIQRISEFLDFRTSTMEQEINVNDVPTQAHNLQTGLNLNIGKNQGLELYYDKTHSNKSVNQKDVILLEEFGVPFKEVLSLADEKINTDQDAINITYQVTDDSLRHKAVFSADFVDFRKKNHSDYFNISTFAEDDPVNEEVRNVSTTKVKVWAGKLDHSFQINDENSLEVGLKISYAETENEVDLVTFNPQTGWESDSLRSNIFAYEEWTQAAYLSHTWSLGKWETKLGLRLERNNTNGASRINGFVFKRKFFQAFPNFSSQYTLKEKHVFGLAYSRRIERPDYIDINPFIYYVNPFTSLEGNPDVTAAFSSNLEFNYLLKQAYSLNLSYSHTKDVIVTVQQQDIVSKQQKLLPINLGTMNYFSLTIGIPIDFVKWWESHNNIQVYHQQYAKDENTPIEFSGTSRTSFQFYTQNAFQLPGKVKMELSGSFTSPSLYGQIKFKSLFYLSFGLKRSFLDNRLTAKLGFKDFLKTYKENGRILENEWSSNYQDYYDSSVIKLTLTYNFRKGKVQKKSANWSSEEEKNRIK